MKMLRFYLGHAIRDMARNRRLTLFALFSIAIGVATVVGMRTISLMIGHTLINNAQTVNQGDIALQAPQTGGLRMLDIGVDDDEAGDNSFTPEDCADIYTWAAENNVEVTLASNQNFVQASKIREDGRSGAPRIIQMFLVDPEVYPFYGTIYATDPKGVPLAELIHAPSDIVLGRSLARQLGATVGDQVRIGTVDGDFTVRGIVPDTSQGGFKNFFALMFGFVFLDIDGAEQFGLSGNPDTLYLRIPEGASVDELDQDMSETLPVKHFIKTTTSDIVKVSKVAVDALNQVVLVFSLAPLFIGGIGIINTMLVIVSRRTLEVAVLKTLGLKGRQISRLFLVEAFMLGVLGSVLGIALGLAGSWAGVTLGKVGEQFVAMPLKWHLTPDPLLIGAAMGIIITSVFGFLPTLAAAQVRPAVVMRPTDLPIPKAGKLRTLFALLVMVVVLGAMIGQIIDIGVKLSESQSSALYGMPPVLINVLVGSICTLVTMILLGIMIGLLWILVWLLGRLPSFGSIDLKLAIRALRGHRTRNASTLLALIIGIGSLSVITLVNSTINKVLNKELTETVGGNVIAMSFTAPTAQGVLDTLTEAEGVKGYIQYSADTMLTMVAINGNYDLQAVAQQSGVPWQDVRHIKNILSDPWGVDMGGEPVYPPLLSGTQITPERMDEPIVILPGTPEVLALGIKPGDTLTYETYENRKITLTVVGIAAPPEENGNSETHIGILGNVPYAPSRVLPESHSTLSFKMTFVNVEDAQIDAVMGRLFDIGSQSMLSQPLVIDISVIDSLIARILNQMTMLPKLASIFSLIAGAVIIANTVALATLERRREIGIMKALGLKGRRILWLLLIENGIIGLLSGLIGVGLGAFPAAWIGREITKGALIMNLPLWDIFWLMAMSIGIAIGATLLTAAGAARQKPLTVLRYE